MAWLSLASLRTRLLLLVFLATIPALGLTLYTNLEERQLERRSCMSTPCGSPASFLRL